MIIVMVTARYCKDYRMVIAMGIVLVIATVNAMVIATVNAMVSNG